MTIVLSGTPLQNDLSEYWAMVDFTCPGLLGKYSAFNKRYEKPILKARSVGCAPEALAEGQMRAEEVCLFALLCICADCFSAVQIV